MFCSPDSARKFSYPSYVVNVLFNLYFLTSYEIPWKSGHSGRNDFKKSKENKKKRFSSIFSTKILNNLEVTKTS